MLCLKWAAEYLIERKMHGLEPGPDGHLSISQIQTWFSLYATDWHIGMLAYRETLDDGKVHEFFRDQVFQMVNATTVNGIYCYIRKNGKGHAVAVKGKFIYDPIWSDSKVQYLEKPRNIDMEAMCYFLRIWW